MEQSETPRQTLLNASDEYSTAQGAVEHALEELFGDNSILGIGWDSYDSSLEIYVWQAEDLCPTPEQRDAILALGFVQFWINFKDGTERHCSAASTGERRTCTHNRWDCYNQGRLEQRKVERRLVAAERELEALRGKLESAENVVLAAKKLGWLTPASTELQGMHGLHLALLAYTDNCAALTPPEK